MATQLPYRHDLDPTGLNPDNKVIGEIHDLPNRTVRAIAPLYGGFFSETLIVRDRANGLVLVKDVQYKTAEMLEFPTGRYGKEICSIILIKDTSVSAQVEVTYQALGGEYGYNVEAIIQMLNSLEMDNRPVAWPDITNKPDAFIPAAHYHDVGDVYGFEYVVHAIERLRSAIIMGDQASHDEIFRYIDTVAVDLNDRMTIVEAVTAAHTGNTSNPHAVTKTQVGLPLVENYQVASTAEAQTGTMNNRYMTPLRTAEAIQALAGGAVSSHINNTNNPHATTKGQVGLGSVENYAISSQADAQAGTSNVFYMTPLRTAQAISTQAGNLINTHTARTDNPHSVTKTQVGLSNVPNYALATQVEAQQFASNTTLMSPFLTKITIDTTVPPLIAAHANRTDNPHSTTAAQVGLGNVWNYGLADQATAEAGTNNTSYMTPLRTAQAISAQVQPSFNTLFAHTANTSNPHSVTKTQVGLSLVNNFAIAALGDLSGSRNDLYMTPFTTAQMLTQYQRTTRTIMTTLANTANRLIYLVAGTYYLYFEAYSAYTPEGSFNPSQSANVGATVLTAVQDYDRGGSSGHSFRIHARGVAIAVITVSTADWYTCTINAPTHPTIARGGKLQIELA